MPDTRASLANVTSAIRVCLGEGAQLRQVERLKGGASTREFYRATLEGGESLIAMITPGMLKLLRTEDRIPFVEVRDLLATRGVRVPTIKARLDSAELLLLEDLGDVTLEAYLKGNPRQREAMYRRAIVDLANAQRALETLPEASVVCCRAFDEALLRWELDHFREWGLEVRGLTLDAETKAVFDRAAVYLAREIASWPRGFVHRDYQCRNLMVRFAETNSVVAKRPEANGSDASGADANGANANGSGSEARAQLVWIDFQDAMLGPRLYDVVALLRDSYQNFDEPFVLSRLDDYAAARGLQAERSRLQEEFDLITVQRKLKDAGRFVYLAKIRKAAEYLPFIDPTLDMVFSALRRLDAPPLRALEKLLLQLLR